jgi:hypothetical protein
MIEGMSMPIAKEFGRLNQFLPPRFPQRSDAVARPRGVDAFDRQDRSPFFPLANRSNTRAYGHGRLHGEYAKSLDGAVAKQSSHIRLDAKHFNVSRQSTELSIRTQDGDVVTIRLLEKERSQESIDLRSHSSENQNSGPSSVAVAVQQRESSSQYTALEAHFSGDQVSDVSYEFASEARENTSVSAEILQNGNRVAVDYRSKTQSSSNLTFEVEGSLDADELKAIGELVGQVHDLAESFFDGDVKAAFEQAKRMGYDKSEIAGYSLNMAEQELSVEMSRYRANSGWGSAIPGAVAGPVGDYLRGYEQSVGGLGRYFENQAIEQILDTIAKINRRDAVEANEVDDQVKRFGSFNDRIRDLLGSVNS